jgi:hypothetical protein
MTHVFAESTSGEEDECSDVVDVECRGVEVGEPGGGVDGPGGITEQDLADGGVLGGAWDRRGYKSMVVHVASNAVLPRSPVSKSP